MTNTHVQNANVGSCARQAVRRLGCITLILVSLASLFSADGPKSAAHIALDPSVRFQRIDGFGLNFTGPYFRDDQRSMFEMLIDDLGVSMFRVVAYLVYSDWEVVNDNDDANLMNWEYYNDRYSTPIFEASWKALRYLNSRGIRPVIALMGPVPEWMTDNRASPPRHKVCRHSAEASASNHLSPTMYEEFAEEVVSMVVYARTQAHVDFEYFSPFNETDCYPVEGPRVDPDEAPKVLAAVARRLQKEGLGDVKLTVADQAVLDNNYIEPILGDANLMKQVGVLTLHNYGESSLSPHLARLKNSSYPHLPVWLSEYGDLKDQDRTAENEWRNFCLAANQRALAALNQGANALFYFNAFDDYEECARRLTYYGLFKSASHVYSPRKRYYATRQLYHFVRPGAQRIDAKSDSPALLVSAFHQASPRSLVVVGVKQGGPNQVQVALPQTENIARTWELYETTRTTNCLKVETVSIRDGQAQLDLPDEAIFTLVGSLD